MSVEIRWNLSRQFKGFLADHPIQALVMGYLVPWIQNGILIQQDAIQLRITIVLQHNTRYIFYSRKFYFLLGIFF